MEYVPTSCPPYEDASQYRYIVNAIECNNGEVSIYSHYGDQLATPAGLANYSASQNYRVIWNKENNHIVQIHRYFKGTIDGRQISAVDSGTVSTDGFNEIFFPNSFTDADNNLNPDCADNAEVVSVDNDPEPITGPCYPGNVEINSNVHIASGNLHIRQPIFSEVETGVPGGIYFSWNSLNNGWQQNSTTALERTWAPSAGVPYTSLVSDGYKAVLRDSDNNGNGKVYPVSWTRASNLDPANQNGPTPPYIKLKQSSGSHLYFSQEITNSDNLTTPSGPVAVSSIADNTITYPNGTILTFNDDGQITTRADRNGLVAQYSYIDKKLTSFSDRHGRTTHYAYNSEDQISTITSPSGRIATLTHTNDQLTQLHLSDGRTWQFSYNNGNLINITDPAGNVKSYAYDTQNRLIEGTNPDGTRTVSYDDVDHSTIITNRDGSVTRHSYDSTQYTPTQIIDAAGYETLYQYDQRNRLINIIDQDGHEQSYTYDDTGNLVQSIDAAGQTTTYNYNSYGQPTTITDGDGNNSQISYDSQGNPTSITLANGLQTLNSYDSLGQLISQQGINGATTNYLYDSNGFIEQITAANGSTTQYQYNIAGQLLQTTDAAGYTSHYTYDNANRLIQSTNSAGESTQYSYNSLDQLTQVTDPEGYSTQLTYDHADRLLTLTRADGSQTSLQYNSLGHKTATTDANQHSYQYTNNHMGQITRITDPLGHITDMAYQNDSISLSQVTDARGNTITYTYDAAGHIITSNTHDVTTHYDYNSNGTINQRTDGRGVITQYHYDSLNRLTDIHYPANSNEDIHYSYDNGTWGGGQLTSTEDSSGTSTYSYNSTGQLIDKTQTIQGTTYQTLYSYDSRGNLINQTYPAGLTVTTSYDALNRPTTIQASYGDLNWDILQQATYHSSGQPLVLHHGNGLTTQANYNTINKLQSLTLGSHLQQQFDYDATGQLATIVQTLPETQETNYNYDAADQLTSADQELDTWLYQYDAVGNRQNISSNDNIETYLYPTNNNQLQQITGTSTQNYSYDQSGNTISINALQLSYNQANRISSITNGDESSQYQYDGNNLRVIKQTATNTTHYHYDTQGHLIAETDDSGALKRAIVWYGQQPMALITMATTNDTQPSTTRSFIAANTDNPEQQHNVTVNSQNHTITITGSTYDGTYAIADNRWHEEPNRTRFSWREGSLKISGNVLTDRRVDGRLRFIVFDENNIITSKTTFKLWNSDATVSENNNDQLDFNAVNVTTSDQLGIQLDQTSHTLTIGTGNYTGTYSIADNRWKNDDDRTRFSYRYNDTTVIRGHIMHTGYRDGMLTFVETIDEVKTKQVYRLWNTAGSDMQPVQINTPSLYHVHCNPIGAPILLTDSNGSAVWSAQYAPFGDAIIDEDPDGDGRGVMFNLRFPGQYYDAESGLLYNWHRYYDPETGRYITADPIGLAGGINQYAYAGGNPVNFVDPEGKYIQFAIPVVITGGIIYLVVRTIDDCAKKYPCNDPTSPERAENIKRCLGQSLPFLDFLLPMSPKSAGMYTGKKTGAYIGEKISE